MAGRRSPTRDGKRQTHIEKRVQERAIVRRFDLSGESVVTCQHQCVIVGRSTNGLRLVSEEPLPIGERLDITFQLNGRDGPRTFSGIARGLTPLGWEPRYFVDIELILDRRAAVWRHQFH